MRWFDRSIVRIHDALSVTIAAAETPGMSCDQSLPYSLENPQAETSSICSIFGLDYVRIR